MTINVDEMLEENESLRARVASQAAQLAVVRKWMARHAHEAPVDNIRELSDAMADAIPDGPNGVGEKTFRGALAVFADGLVSRILAKISHALDGQQADLPCAHDIETLASAACDLAEAAQRLRGEVRS